jgi:hypothetical protein
MGSATGYAGVGPRSYPRGDCDSLRQPSLHERPTYRVDPKSGAVRARRRRHHRRAPCGGVSCPRPSTSAGRGRGRLLRRRTPGQVSCGAGGLAPVKGARHAPDPARCAGPDPRPPPPRPTSAPRSPPTTTATSPRPGCGSPRSRPGSGASATPRSRLRRGASRRVRRGADRGRDGVPEEGCPLRRGAAAVLRDGGADGELSARPVDPSGATGGTSIAAPGRRGAEDRVDTARAPRRRDEPGRGLDPPSAPLPGVVNDDLARLQDEPSR